VRRLLHREPREEPQFDDPQLLGVPVPKSLERLVDSQHIRRADCGDSLAGGIEREENGGAAPLLRVVGAGVVSGWSRSCPFWRQSGCPTEPERTMSSFAIYLIGFVVLIVGLALAAYLLSVPSLWIGVGIVVLIGIGILSGVARTRRPDPPAT
jgi:hypothetical protein